MQLAPGKSECVDNAIHRENDVLVAVEFKGHWTRAQRPAGIHVPEDFAAIRIERNQVLGHVGGENQMTMRRKNSGLAAAALCVRDPASLARLDVDRFQHRL